MRIDGTFHFESTKFFLSNWEENRKKKKNSIQTFPPFYFYNKSIRVIYSLSLALFPSLLSNTHDGKHKEMK